MSKFNTTRPVRTRTGTGVISTASVAAGSTFEGAPGYARDAKSELFLLAVVNMVSENTFYETGKDRDNRFRQLVQKVAVEDPQWTKDFLAWLRNDANMRSASLVGGLEAAAALVLAGVTGARQLVNSVLLRGDEPGEALAYWLNSYGRRIPQPIKRGIADAAERLYNEFNVLKYDTASHGVRFADVLELTHPKATVPGQAELYKFVLARRHGREFTIGDSLPMVAAQQVVREHVSQGDFAPLLSSSMLHMAGMTWEDALSLAGPSVDKKALWEALIPSMGYMAQLRNLRNFDQAGVSNDAAERVAARLADPDQVARSRQFPFRFLSAYKAAQGSLRWGAALEKALQASLANVPELPGKTLVLVDLSGSMWAPMSAKSQLQRWEAAALFGTVLALRNGDRATLVKFGSDSQELRFPAGTAVLHAVTQHFASMGGTYTAAATRKHFAGHDRVVIVTDEQSHDGNPGGVVPADVPVYTWNLGGYQYSHGPSGKDGRYTFGGLTDQAFQMIPLLERGVSETWPWEN